MQSTSGDHFPDELIPCSSTDRCKHLQLSATKTGGRLPTVISTASSYTATGHGSTGPQRPLLHASSPRQLLDRMMAHPSSFMMGLVTEASHERHKEAASLSMKMPRRSMLAALPHAKASPVQDSVYLYAPKHLLWRQEAEADGLRKLPVAAADLVTLAPSRIAHEEALRQVCGQTGTGRFAPWTRLMHLLRGGPHSQTLSVLSFQGGVAGPTRARARWVRVRFAKRHTQAERSFRPSNPQLESPSNLQSASDSKPNLAPGRRCRPARRPPTCRCPASGCRPFASP